MKAYRNSTSSSVEYLIDLKTSSGSSIKKLKQYELQQCEFCDKSFINRYSILKHNASHIIIPLIKQPMYQCDECLYHFTSVDDLITHTVKKHKDIVDRENDINERAELKLENDNVTEILQSMVEKQVFVKCEDELKEVFVKCNKLRKNSDAIETFETHDSFETHETFATHDSNESFEIFGKHEVISQPNKIEPLYDLKDEITEYLNASSRSISPKAKIDLKPRSVTSNRVTSPTDEEKESIRNRLLFEEDLEDTLFKDLSSDCKVSLETLCQQVNLDIDENLALLNQNLDLDLTMNLDSSSSLDLPLLDKRASNTAEVTTELLKFGTAIHYDYLVEPEVCTCKWCGKNFPSRFKLLQHESKHLKVKPKAWRLVLCCVCERFIAGNYRNLRKHTQTEHPEYLDPNISYKTYNCPKCRLKYYNFKTHLKRCHNFYNCQKCENGFESEKRLDEHKCVKIQVDYDKVINGEMVYKRAKDDCEPTTNGLAKSLKCKTTTVQLCDMCYSFLKISVHNYSRYEVVGEKCEVGVQQTCDKCKNLFFAVKLVKRHVRVPDESKPMRRHHMKPLTNKERLKKIHTRLKIMKMINKC